MEFLNVLSLLVSACAAGAAAFAVVLAMRERQTDMKEDFVLWAIERLREQPAREARRVVFMLTAEEWSELEGVARAQGQDTRLEQVRAMCLSFEEIGYFVFKVGLVNYRDILDMYPQAVRLWNRAAPLVRVWRETEHPTAFVYFEMLARQERLAISPEFETPTKLYL